MKKIFIFIFALVIFSLVLNFNSKTYKSMEEAIYAKNPEIVQIIHDEELASGSIVFAKRRDDEDRLDIYTIRETFGRYKVDYSARLGDTDKIIEAFGMNIVYFPAIKGGWEPVFMGILDDENIESVKVEEIDGENYREAKVVNTSYKKIFIREVDGLKGSKFNIVGLSKDGEKILEFKHSLGTWKVEQRPFKGY